MKLFPRLPSRFAEDLFAEQVLMPIDEIKGSTSHRLSIWPATGADRITDVELSDLRARVLRVSEDHRYPDPVARTDQSALDIALARELWDTTALSPSEAAFADVWSFLALVLVPDVVWWRAAGSSNIERFVATDLTRHTLARLWWRAFLFTWGIEEPEDGWELWRSSRIGEADLDQIQTRRGGYGRSAKAFRTLVRVYPFVTDLAQEVGVDRRTLWRQMFLRWVLRLGAFIEFNAMSEQALLEDLTAIATDVARTSDAALLDARDDRAESDVLAPADGPITFDALALNSLVVVLTEAIRSSGKVAAEDLPTAFERASGISVPAERAEILRGIAWQGDALKYLAHLKADGTTVWRPGLVLPAPDRRWGEWSIETFKEYVGDSNGAEEKNLYSVLFKGRPGTTVKRVVRAAVRESRATQT